MNVYPFIEAEQAEGNVTKACALMEVSRSAYYDWHQHRPSRRRLADEALGERIGAVFDASRGTYGWPRVHAALRREGICVSRKRVARIMRQRGLIGRCLRKKTRTTVSDAEARAADLIKRAFGPGTVEVNPASTSATSPTSGPRRAGCTWPRSSTWPPAGWRGGRWPITCTPAWSVTPSPWPSTPDAPARD